MQGKKIFNIFVEIKNINIMSKLKFKKQVSEQPTSDFWYDCTIGGYIKPEDFLEPEDAKRVSEAIKLLRQFEYEAEERGLIYSL